MKYLLLFFLTIPTLDAQNIKDTTTSKSPTYQYDLQGHRGARGLAPENTLQAFRKALEVGVNTLELDIVVSKDRQILVSHEPWMNADICLSAEGEPIEKEKEKTYNIYEMTYEEVKTFDCGSKYNDAFPEQMLETAYKPLLKEVLSMVDSISSNNGRKINYNIELKSLPEGDNMYHPQPEVFVKLVMDLLQHEADLDRITLQSFDFRILQELNKSYPEVRLAVLVYKIDLESALDQLGFIPEIYSPYFPLVNKNLIKVVHSKGMEIIPWTVNEPEQMKSLLKLGVDGLITDYPDRAIRYRQ